MTAKRNSGDRLKVACLGMGWWSDVLADAMKRSERFEIVSCYTRSEQKRETFARKYGYRAARSYEDSFAIRNSIFDVYLMGIMDLVGYVFQRFHLAIAPVVLGLVLGETLERQYRTALILSEGSYRIFVSSIPSVIFLSLSALTIGWQVWSSVRERKR
jgi:hypothetical protein